ncbi:MAG TPA: cupin domain-containing protein [Pyrinomonadaceae bacterium]|jgi:hypothetical protein|nr:cupin domain-containing protein [Pyrinomonadaceae bacterium]
MNIDDLRKLNDAVKDLLKQESFRENLEQLKREVSDTSESFVWSTVDLNSINSELPGEIKSCWTFVLKKNVPSGCHYHPNSIQHMIMIEGQGESKVADIRKRMIGFGSNDHSLDETWYVIPEGVPHEFFPELTDMVVVSFHTCEARELQEIGCETGETRLYEPLAES